MRKSFSNNVQEIYSSSFMNCICSLSNVVLNGGELSAVYLFLSEKLCIFF